MPSADLERIKQKLRFRNQQAIDGTSDVNFSIFALEVLKNYVISENPNITQGNLMKLRTLMGMLDIKTYYSDDMRKNEAIQFINKGLEARLDLGINSKEMALQHILGPNVEPSTYMGFEEITDHQLQWINTTVEEALKECHMCHDLFNIYNKLSDYKSADYTKRGPMLKEIEVLFRDLVNKFRQSRMNEDKSPMFSLNPDVCRERVVSFHSNLNDDTNKLRTGMLAFNRVLNGGVEMTRVYVVLGMPGEGKSITLLDLARQLKIYNKDYVPRDPSKRPCIVILTMENTDQETFERLFSMVSLGGKVTDQSPEKIMEILKEGGLYISDDNPIDLIIKYIPGNSVNTEYLYDLYDELYDNGYEMICLCQDYLKKINSSMLHSTSEVRLEYGAVVNELKSFAVDKKVAVITASQLNREATRVADSERAAGSSNILAGIGRNNIGESMLILENADAAFIIAPTMVMIKGEQRKVLGVRVIKTRYENPGPEIFYQLYEERCPIRLVEDINLKEPAYALTTADFGPDNSKFVNSPKNQIKEFVDAFKDDDEDDDEICLDFESLGRVVRAKRYKIKRKLSNAFEHVRNGFVHVTNEFKPLQPAFVHI